MNAIRRLSSWTANPGCAMYLTGVSTDASRSARRLSLGVLAQPDNSVHRDIDAGHYAVFGADNGFYGLGSKHDPTPAEVDAATERWLRWVEDEVAPRRDRCLFATIPDVLNWQTAEDGKRFPIGDAEATLARYPVYAAKVRSFGIKAALVAQDGLRSEGDALRSGSQSLSWAQVDCLFVGGSDAFKLGADAEALCREALRRGLWVHVGRVNSWKRIDLVRRHVNSVDGTFLKYGRKGENWPRMEGWLDRLEASGRSLATANVGSSNQTRGGDYMPTKAPATKKAAPRRSTAAEKAKRSAVKQVVEPGKAHSKRAHAESKARVQANADKVADINRERKAADEVIDASTREGWQARVAKAREEAKARTAWKQAGEKGPQPPTPNLDAHNADHEKGIRMPAKNAGKTRASRTSDRGPRGEAAMAEKKRTNDKRGPGVKMTDEELLQYVIKVRRENPESSSADERAYAYWIGTGSPSKPKGIALSGNTRWDAAWKKAEEELKPAARKAS